MFLESEVKSDQQFENVHFCIPVATKWLYLKTKPQKILVFLVKKMAAYRNYITVEMVVTNVVTMIRLCVW